LPPRSFFSSVDGGPPPGDEGPTIGPAAATTNYIPPLLSSSLPRRSSWSSREGDRRTSPHRRQTWTPRRVAVRGQSVPPLPCLRRHEQAQAEQPRSRSVGVDVESLVAWRGRPQRKEVRRPYHCTRSRPVAARRLHARTEAGFEISTTELHFPSPLTGFGGLGRAASLGLTTVVIELSRPAPPWGLL
jgi:hypothetical protein